VANNSCTVCERCCKFACNREAAEVHSFDYSFVGLVRNALSGHRHWRPAWRSPQPKKSYNIIIIGGGGHGLSAIASISGFLVSNEVWRSISQRGGWPQ
jgi:hypothetical protein